MVSSRQPQTGRQMKTQLQNHPAKVSSTHTGRQMKGNANGCVWSRHPTHKDIVGAAISFGRYMEHTEKNVYWETSLFGEKSAQGW